MKRSETTEHSQSTTSLSSLLTRSRHVLYLAPSGLDVGLTSVALGFMRALDQNGIPAIFFKPIATPADGSNGSTNGSDKKNGSSSSSSSSTPTVQDRSVLLLQAGMMGGHDLEYLVDPISWAEAEQLLRSENDAALLEKIVDNFHSNLLEDASVFVVEGIQATPDRPDLDALNHSIVRALDAEVIIVAAPSTSSSNDNVLADLNDRIEHVAHAYGGLKILACWDALSTNSMHPVDPLLRHWTCLVVVHEPPL